MKYLIYFLTILLISSCSIYRNSYEVLWSHHKTIDSVEIEEKIPANKLQQDIDYFIKTLEAVHVSPYHNISKKEFASYVNQAKSEIDKPLTRKEFYRIVTPLVHKLKDSHTTVWYPKEFYQNYKGGFFPMDISINPDTKEIAVVNDYTNTIETGANIISINGVSSQEILKTLLEFEKGATDLPRIKRVQDKFPNMLWEIFDYGNQFVIETENGETHKINGLTKQEIRERKPSNQDKKHLKQVDYVKMNSTTGYLKISSFKYNRQDFKQKIDDIFNKIKTDSIENLIVDVRNNQGGSESNGELLIDYISNKEYRMFSKFMRKKSNEWCNYFRQDFKWWIRWGLTVRTSTWVSSEAKEAFGTYKKTPYGKVDTIFVPFKQPTNNQLRFSGKVVVLMNRHSYSATVGFLGAIIDNKMATTIGEETGENTNGFGEAYQFDLPNSRLFCRSSTTFMLRPNEDPNMMIGLLPDIKILQNLDDIKQGKDTQLEYVIKYFEQ